MSDPLSTMLAVARSGLSAQSRRLQVISENIANSRSSPSTPNDTPYTRKTVTFRAELDRASGASLVKLGSVGADTAPYLTEFNPTHEGADERGYVRMPNVNIYIEMADLREANRAYQANLQSIRSAREIQTMTVDLLKG